MKKKDEGSEGEGPSGKRRRSRKDNDKQEHAQEGGSSGAGPDKMLMPAHLYVGPRDVRIPLGEDGMKKVLIDQKEIRHQIAEAINHRAAKQKQIDETQEMLAKHRAQYRELEQLEQELHERLLEIIDANADGYHIDRLEVDEVFINGEIVTYRRGTQEEVGQRRNALPIEWEEAKKVRTDGKPVDRWQKAVKPAERKGFVVIDGGKEGPKEVRASADGYGYIGPDDDPRKPPKTGKEEKKRGPKAKGQKVLPNSLHPTPELSELDPPKGEEKKRPGPQKGTFAVRLTDISGNQIGAIKAVRQAIDVNLSEAKKIVHGDMPVELTRDLTEDNAHTIVQMFETAGVKAEAFNTAAAAEPDPST